MKLSLKLYLALALGCLPSFAVADGVDRVKSCALTYEADLALARDAAASEVGAKLFDYGDDDSAKLVYALNTTPPISSIVADRVLVLVHHDGPVKVAFIRDGCAAEAFVVTSDEWSELMALAAGI